MNTRLPFVVILGSTGTGKTKLAIELARKFKGEIISADSMQIYKGLDIVTAKATAKEQALAPHHMIDIIEPHESYTVVEYRNKALTIVDHLLKMNKLPIIVGGTNYYIEALLWKILIDGTKDPGQFLQANIYHNDFELPSEELHKKLKLLDPNMAKRLHPQNKRKILRSLEVFYKMGVPHSELLEKQQTSSGASLSGGALRFEKAIIFKLECEKIVLDERLNMRVDKMMEQGLVQELLDFHQKYNQQRLKSNEPADYTKGVFQSIGFKEFHNYLIMSPEDQKSEKGEEELKKAIEQLKMVTRRYARKQNKWIKNRFLGRLDRQVPPLYGLNVTQLDDWDEKVKSPAIEIIENFISQTPCSYQPLPMQEVKSSANAEDDTFYCDICDRVFIGTFQWEIHCSSKRHKRVKSKKLLLNHQT